LPFDAVPGSFSGFLEVESWQFDLVQAAPNALKGGVTQQYLSSCRQL